MPAEVRALAPNVPWRRLAGLRDVLAHAYFGIDEDVLWDIVSTKVGDVAPRLQELLERIQASP